MILIALHMHVMLYVAVVAPLDQYAYGKEWIRIALNAGWQTMDFFFVLSGFLIGRLLLEMQSAEGFRLKSTLAFYVKRGFRIFPLYYVTLFLLWGVVQFWPIFSVNGVTQINWIPELFYLSNYTRDQPVLAPWSWSLSLEEHLYIAAPFAVASTLSIPSMRGRFVFLFVSASIPLILRYLVVDQSVGAHGTMENAAPPLNIFKDLFIPTHLRFDTFLYGLAGAILVYCYPDHFKMLLHGKHQRWLRVFLWTVVIVLYLYFILPFFHEVPFMYLSYGGMSDTPTLLSVAMKSVWDFGFLSSMLYLILIVLLVTDQGALGSFLGSTWMRKTATLSYGVYLVHLPIAKFVSHTLSKYLGEGPIGIALVSLGLTAFLSYGLSYILHLIVEKPLLSVRDRIFT